MQENKIITSIIKTLSYSDIFDFPLTREEIYKYYIGEKVSRGAMSHVLREMVKAGQISKENNLYFLNGRQKLCKIRKNRKTESVPKMVLALKTIDILHFIPTIKLIGVSGSLSMENCERKDDVDLFIVTDGNALWITRLIVSLVLSVLGIKRDRKDNFGINKICPNMYLTLSSLSISPNLFAAHELSQLKVIFNRDFTYQALLDSNSWVSKFMPNVSKTKNYITTQPKDNFLVSFLDRISYYLQLKYMKDRITKETVTRDKALFHPRDKTHFVEAIFASKCKGYLDYLSQLKASSQSTFSEAHPILQDIDI